MIGAEYQHVLDRCNGRLEIQEQRERWRLLQGWRELYAAGLRATNGRWKLGLFEWHVFSFGHARAHSGTRAVAEYEAQHARSFVICPERESLPAVRIADGTLPDFCATCEDIYVWPDDLAWTMAFTHEEGAGLGPYFSRREWIV